MKPHPNPELSYCKHPSKYKALNVQMQQQRGLLSLFTWTDAYSKTTQGKGRNKHPIKTNTNPKSIANEQQTTINEQLLAIPSIIKPCQ